MSSPAPAWSSATTSTRRATKVGEDGGTCTVVRVTEAGAITMHCLGTNTLPGGQVVGGNTSSTEMEIDLTLR